MHCPLAPLFHPLYSFLLPHERCFCFRFMRAAALPDDLEMILEDHRLSVSGTLVLSNCAQFVLK